jgi:hypothetical protein
MTETSNESNVVRYVSELPLSPDLLPPDGGIEIMRVFLGGWSESTYNGTCVELAERFDSAEEIGETLADIAREIARCISWVRPACAQDATQDGRLAEIRRSFEQALDDAKPCVRELPVPLPSGMEGTEEMRVFMDCDGGLHVTPVWDLFDYAYDIGHHLAEVVRVIARDLPDHMNEGALAEIRLGFIEAFESDRGCYNADSHVRAARMRLSANRA